MKVLIAILFLIVSQSHNEVVPKELSVLDKNKIVREVNKLRAKGCYCGGKKIKPVGPIVWNETLQKSAMAHAQEMSKFNFFTHYSRDGLDIGQRLTRIGYPWKVVGENIAEGQKNFSQVMKDWIRSETHCKMLMDKRVNEMAVARYNNYWVQHFGKQQRKPAHWQGKKH